MTTSPSRDDLYSADSNGGSSSKLFGILTRKTRWRLSWRGWLIIAAIVGVVTGLVVLGIYPFLAITNRVNADFLVVEGWVHQYTAGAAAEEFRARSYQRVFATGGPVNGSGGYINDQNTSASVGADLLKKAGVPSELVQMVPSRVLGRDRTYSSAIALREWFRQHNLQVRSINVVTEDAHARRTRLLFQKALGNGVKVGIISVPSPDYDAKHWWRYSEGVREVIGESIAYIYAKIFFSPE
jgi:uncharacterized SAM-binding protein YcdF (DUF218 family)